MIQQHLYNNEYHLQRVILIIMLLPIHFGTLGPYTFFNDNYNYHKDSEDE